MNLLHTDNQDSVRPGFYAILTVKFENRGFRTNAQLSLVQKMTDCHIQKVDQAKGKEILEVK